MERLPLGQSVVTKVKEITQGVENPAFFSCLPETMTKYTGLTPVISLPSFYLSASTRIRKKKQLQLLEECPS